ncbi:MAG: helix-turn-helix domain-containing protein [Acidimicrobiales bacterium]
MPDTAGTPPEEYRALLSAGPSLVAEAARALEAGTRPSGGRPQGGAPTASTPGAPDAAVALQALVSHLAAAVLVDDGRVLRDFLSAEMARTAEAGRPAEHLMDCLDSLAAALPAGLSRSRAFVADARRWLRPVLDQAVASLRVPLAGAGQGEGQAVADLLFLGALACHAPLALVSVPGPDRQWRTLALGVDRRGQLDDPVLLEFMAAAGGPVEVADIAAHPQLSASVLGREPLGLVWVYGSPVLDPSGKLLAVFCALDRRRRQTSPRDQRAVVAVVRQLGNHLCRLGGSSASGPGPAGYRLGSAGGDAAAVASTQGGAAAGPTGLADASGGQQLLRSHEVAAIFDVTERTVINWAAAGKLPALRTMGGHLRFRADDVRAVVARRANPVPRRR